MMICIAHLLRDISHNYLHKNSPFSSILIVVLIWGYLIYHLGELCTRCKEMLCEFSFISFYVK